MQTDCDKMMQLFHVPRGTPTSTKLREQGCCLPALLDQSIFQYTLSVKQEL